MKTYIEIETDHEAMSYISGITYANVPAWYDATRKDLKMDLIVPKVRDTGRKLPAVLWFCGGAYRVMDRAVWMPELMQLARRGFVVASADYRTSNEASFPAALEDAKTAVRYLKAHAAQYCIDPDRICAAGESAGGTIAVLLGTTGSAAEYDTGGWAQYSSDVSAVVDFYGGGNMQDMPAFTGTRDVPPWTIDDFLGAGHTEETVRKASAVNWISPDTPPFLIFHGSADQTVSIAQSEELYERLQAAGIESDFYILQGAGHGEDSFYQKNIMDIINAFLQRVM